MLGWFWAMRIAPIDGKVPLIPGEQIGSSYSQDRTPKSAVHVSPTTFQATFADRHSW